MWRIGEGVGFPGTGGTSSCEWWDTVLGAERWSSGGGALTAGPSLPSVVSHFSKE
jgi:hypothetical protein